MTISDLESSDKEENEEARENNQLDEELDEELMKITTPHKRKIPEACIVQSKRKCYLKNGVKFSAIQRISLKFCELRVHQNFYSSSFEFFRFNFCIASVTRSAILSSNASHMILNFVSKCFFI